MNITQTIQAIKNFFARTQVITHDADEPNGSQNLPFFVYGTLRPGEGNYSWSLDGETTKEVVGFLAGTSMYSNGGFPYVLEHSVGKGVQGTLIYVKPESYDKVFASLDMLEGTRYGDDVPGVGKVHDNNHYNRLIRLIQVDKDTFVKAWVYMPPTVDHEKIMAMHAYVPSGNWYEREHRYGTPRVRTRRTYGGSNGVSDEQRQEMVEFWETNSTV